MLKVKYATSSTKNPVRHLWNFSLAIFQAIYVGLNSIYNISENLLLGSLTHII